MAEQHPSFVQPNDTSTPIWRYTDLSKFAWMLQRQALYFARADTLGDPYEGYSTRPMVEGYTEAIVDALRGVNQQQGKPFDEAAVRASARKRAHKPFARRLLYVNCWHVNQHESAAMWKLYTSMRDSICIRSAYKQLWDCLPSKECYLGEVRYVDYETDAFDHSNLFSLVMHKRTSYAHEHEVRAVIMNVSAGNIGV